MEYIEKLLSANLSDEPSKKLRHRVIWREFMQKVTYISNNPKYREIDITIGDVFDEKGGVSSDSQSPPT